MTIELHQLPSPNHRRKRRVGRGAGSGRGTYAGRGLKGQRARSGGRRGLKVRGLKQFMMQMPKKRGFISHYPKLFVVNLSVLESHFQDGERVTEKQLIAKGLCPKLCKGVKILGTGKLNKKLKVEAAAFSASAKDAILNSGGSVEIRNRFKRAGTKGLKNKAKTSHPKNSKTASSETAVTSS